VAKGFKSLKSDGNFVGTRVAGSLFFRSSNPNGRANVIGLENLPNTNSGFKKELGIEY
jgi:hypothetical protein